jgi:hypothetical protein
MLQKLRNNVTSVYFYFPVEAIFWSAALILLAFNNPITDQHFSFCIFKILGFKYCPGCGIGRSISFLLRGDIRASFNLHPLGIPAFLILTYRIIDLSYIFFNNFKTHNNGKRIENFT